MKKFMFAVMALVGAGQLATAVSAIEPTQGIRKGGDGVSGRVIPMRDADQSPAAIASSPAEVAERAERKLANHAESIGDGVSSALASIPPNDNCASSTAIAGPGTFNFDNSMATLDGGAHVACIDAAVDPIGTIDHDVWYCWTAPCTGPVVIQTCNQTTVDSKLAVYDGCTCPATSANLLGCDDDGCGTGSFLQSRRTFLAETGQNYLIRLGTYPGDIGDPNNPNDDLPPAPGGVGSFSVTCLNPPCSQPDANCQEINAFNGSLSNQLNSIVADNFEPASSGTITNVCWWGSYGSDNPPVSDSFRIRYFTNNASNLPGTAINVTPFQQGSNLTVSGPVETVVLGADYPIFEFSATHAGIPVILGQTYWIEISNNLAGADNWYWQQGFGEDRLSLQDGAKQGLPLDPIDGYTAADSVDSDMAFCAGVPIVQPPPTSPCLTATNSCCAASATEEGCNNQTCCEAVCTCDPFCCQVAWDINCATVGLEGDCGAQITCPGLCSGCPDGTITFTNAGPLACTVDAREPHTLNDNASPEGITQLVFTGPSGADNESCWTVTAPNSVQNIVDNGDGTFTMSLLQPTAAFAVTQISYVSDTNVTQTSEFISHPGNVNANAMTDNADVFALTACCLNHSCTPVHGVYSCDIDRSGIVSSEDLSRLIDLLNGGNAFSLWNQTPKPTSACP